MAACIEPAQGCAVGLPPVTKGSQFTYVGTGNFFGLDGAVSVGGAPSDVNFTNGTFEQGATLTITLGDSPETSFDWTGRTVDAANVVFTVNQGDDRVLQFREERIDLQTGSLTEVVNNVAMRAGNHTVVHHRYAVPFLPPASGLGLFWGHNFTKGAVIEASFPEPLFFPRNESMIRWSKVHLMADKATLSENGECSVRFSGTFEDYRFRNQPEKAAPHIEAEVRSGIPVPVSYRLLVDGSEFFSLNLDTWNLGPGEPVPAFLPQQEQERFLGTGLQLHPLEEGFLPMGAARFPTGFDEALSALRNDSKSSSWFAEHPAAVISNVNHDYADGSNKYHDSWHFEWFDPADASGASAEVWKEERLWPIRGMPVVYVSFDAPKAVEAPVPLLTGPSLADLERITQALHQGRLETLRCWLEDGLCNFGTVSKTGRPYFGQTGGTVSFGGIQVWLERGLILSNAEYTQE